MTGPDSLGDPTAKDAAALIGCGIDDMRKLAACHVISSHPHGRSVRYDRARVEEIAAWPELHRLREPAAVAVRMGMPSEVAPDRDWPDRTHVGWNEQWSQRRKQNAARGWWRIGPEYRQPGTALVVVVGIVVVAVYHVVGDDTPSELIGGLTRLAVAKPTEEQLAKFSKRRLKLGPGPLSVGSVGWPAPPVAQ